METQPFDKKNENPNPKHDVHIEDIVSDRIGSDHG